MLRIEMKKLLSPLIIALIFICLTGGRKSFCGMEDWDFRVKRLARKFDLQTICQKHSEEALSCYNIATDGLANIKACLPEEVFEQVEVQKDFSFLPPKKSTNLLTLFEICVHKVANHHLTNLDKQTIHLINTLRNIIFHAKVKECYDPKLAKLLIRLHLEKNYKPEEKLLDTCLCTASYLGDAVAVEVLLSRGANCNYVNISEDYYTSLAYALSEEHLCSKIKNKSSFTQKLILDYERIAEMLIKAGARVKHKITGKIKRIPIFFQTSNVNIFNLFEDQIANKTNLFRDLVINAFKFGNAEFIKKLYANPIYWKHGGYSHDHIVNADIDKKTTFMDLAILYYKGYDFEELYKFLEENGVRSTKQQYSLNEFAYRCLNNAISTFDYDSIKNLAEVGVSLKSIYPDTESTTLIYCIKKATVYTDVPAINDLIKIIELFINVGINPAHRDKYGKTALYYAKMLELKAINHINIKAHKENLQAFKRITQALIVTPIIYVIKRRLPSTNILAYINCGKQLKGEIASYRDSHGKTALDYAQEFNSDYSVIEALRSYTCENFE